MTEKQKYYLWFALIVSICMTILMEIFQLYTLPVLGILELFMLVNVCMITVNLFIRKCVNHVETLIVTGCFFLFPACAKYIYAFVFYLVHLRIPRISPGIYCFLARCLDDWSADPPYIE